MTSGVVTPARSSALGVAERGGSSADQLRSAIASRVYLPACAIALLAAILIWFDGRTIGAGRTSPVR